MMAFPFSIQWREEPTLDVPCQLMVVAPKRRFHNAVDRNRVKRLVRESYRHLKPQLYATLQQHDIRLTLSMVYVCNEILSYDKIYQKTEKALAMLVKDIEAHEQAAADK